MPVRFLIERAISDGVITLFVQVGRRLNRHIQSFAAFRHKNARAIPIARLPHFEAVYRKIDKMTQPVTHIASSRFDSLNPIDIVERLPRFGFDINPPQSHSLAVDARKIGFPTDSSREPAIQCVVPDIQFPNAWRIHSGDKVATVMNYVNDIFIGANAIKLGHLVIRQVRALHGESPTTVRKSNHSPLLFSELKHWQIPTRPLTDRLRFRSLENTRFTRVTPIELCGCRPDIIVLSQIQKAKMARMRRRKSGHLHIVAHQVLGLR